MHCCQAYSDFNINGWSASLIESEMNKKKIDTYFWRNTTIECPCEKTVSPWPLLVQCQECGVWQHTRCVVISEDPEDVVPLVPPQFYCGVCRIRRADPFWVTLPSFDSCLFKAVKLISNVNWIYPPMLSMEREFHLGRSTCELLHRRRDYEIQVWCILLNDRVPFRIHWPVCANLRVNGLPFWPDARPTTEWWLGINYRHCGSIVTDAVHEGVNRISLTGSDARKFCWGIRIVKRRTIQEVVKLILEEPNGEPFEDALARVCRCKGSGSAINNAKDGEDSDDDLEIALAIIDLCCPLSGSIMKIAGRFRPCTHVGCFDLRTIVAISEHFRKWQCPICLKTYSFEDIIVDPYFNRVVAKMHRYGDGTCIEVKSDGSWRAENHAQWHLPDSTPIVPEKDLILSLGSLNPIILNKDGTS